jgi:hypothetical protein
MPEIFFILGRNEQHKIKNVYRPSIKVPNIIPVILEFFLQIFETYSNIKFHENPSSESQTVPCGQSEKHDKIDGHFSLFCKHA